VQRKHPWLCDTFAEHSTKMKYYINLLIFLIFLSCQNSSKTEKETKEKNEVDFSQIMKKSPNLNPKQINPKDIDTIYIDYLANIKKLEILTLLPDSCFDSWKWAKEERKIFEKSIKTTGYYIDSTPFYNTVDKAKNNYFGTHVVDGYWEFAIFNSNESYIVIVNDKVGDGDVIFVYEYKNKELKDITKNFLNILSPENYLKNKTNSLNCLGELEEDFKVLFEYNFENINKVEIDGSWSINEKEHSKCLDGNYIALTFDKNTKTFKEQIKWKKKDIE
jgi:hypothetical protein